MFLENSIENIGCAVHKYVFNFKEKERKSTIISLFALQDGVSLLQFIL